MNAPEPRRSDNLDKRDDMREPQWLGDREMAIAAAALLLTEDHSNLQLAPGRCDKGGFNDCTTSIRVIPP
jgi:hypothetical protein